MTVDAKSTEVLRDLLKPTSLTLVTVYRLCKSGEIPSIRAVLRRAREEFGIASHGTVGRALTKLHAHGLIEIGRASRFPFKYKVTVTKYGVEFAKRIEGIVAFTTALTTDTVVRD